ncbi:PKD domain-containing protein [Jatrophihabitans telluris]|uniref:PKD domain-containing protein n=1 Tax=Jatrophihabitans telluris TaxID=2038343 RepID=A0ABY4R0K7_9ACTN|nr:PKD domain-containing protein [Jatrophihabitans telluris]UQX89374.1 PKD domain-containing protein [Jatrophihabitans telluris]
MSTVSRYSATAARRPRRGLVALVAAALTVGVLSVATTAPAVADTLPPNGTPATVSDDSLPVWQINGVVWAQVVVGNTVYATGSFTSARPPGSTAGNNEVARSNLLAYDITTGNLITSFNHALNAQGLAIAASPDGTRLYVGGDFTTVDGVSHSRLAAFDLSTGGLVNSFAPLMGTTVRAVAATNTTVYAGGDFSAVGGVARAKIAAVDTSGALTTWNPGAGAPVTALAMSPDGTKLIVGGRFTTLAGVSRYGLGAVSAATGLATNWVANPVVRDAGNNSSITSLNSDGTNIYGSGYVFGSGGNVEGTFAIKDDGSLVWLNDCHGDTYSAYPIGSVVYSVAHSHFCGNMGAFPETNPRSYHHALASTTYATGTLSRNTINGYTNFQGQPDSTQLDWYPDLSTGSYTGQGQAAWSVTGNAQYVVLAGEFPIVNGKAQQGLARFAVANLATNKLGPTASAKITPTASMQNSTSIKLTWGTTWDPDNGALTYKVYRDGSTIALNSRTVDTRFWTAPNPTQAFTDTNVPNGSHTYVIKVSDGWGNTIASAASNVVTIAGSNNAPTASFTNACTALDCTFDGSASSDSDGSISSYAWDFGDSTTAAGPTPAHSYSAAGTYTVTLTVTDNLGATGQQSTAVTVVQGNPLPPGAFAYDTFDRTVASGWGGAILGGAWSGSTGALSVTPGAGNLTLNTPAGSASAYLASTAHADSVVTAAVSLNQLATGGGSYFGLLARRLDTTHNYTGRVRITSAGAVLVSLTKLDGSSTAVTLGTEKGVAGLTYTPGSKLDLQLAVTTSGGLNHLSVTAWADGTPQPAAQLSFDDTSTALQAAGAVGAWGYLSGSSTVTGIVNSVSAFQAVAP